MTYPGRRVSTKAHIRTFKPITLAAMHNGFLWIGGNTLGNNEISHWRGPHKELSKFKKEVGLALNKYVKKKKLKSWNIKMPKDIGNFTEAKVMVDLFRPDTKAEASMAKQKKSWSVKPKVVHQFLDSFAIDKKKTVFYLPLLISGTRQDHPIKNEAEAFVLLNGKKIEVRASTKTVVRQVTQWLKRVFSLSKIM
jgi:hypothetical protein